MRRTLNQRVLVFLLVVFGTKRDIFIPIGIKVGTSGLIGGKPATESPLQDQSLKRVQLEDKVNIISKRLKISFATAAILAMSAVSGLARQNHEQIDAQAYGTSTQMGKNFTVRLIIYEYSTPEDRKILIESFQKGQNDGLANALEKMKAVGRITMPGTLGFDVSYIREIKTPTGRSIRFVTNRKIAFGESYWSTQSKSFNLTAGEIRINDQDKNKSDGVLYPASQLTINKDGEPQWDLRMNPWKLNNIIVWPGGDKEK
jgi:hypothetical protein